MNISYPGSQSVNAHFGQFKYFCKVLKTDFETFFKYRVGTLSYAVAKNLWKLLDLGWFLDTMSGIFFGHFSAIEQIDFELTEKKSYWSECLKI